MDNNEMTLLLSRLVSRTVEKSENYEEARQTLQELGFSDEQMVLLGFPKIVMSILQEEEKK